MFLRPEWRTKLCCGAVSLLLVLLLIDQTADVEERRWELISRTEQC